MKISRILAMVLAAGILFGCSFPLMQVTPQAGTPTDWLSGTLTAIALAQPSPSPAVTETPLPPSPTTPSLPSGKIVFTCHLLDATHDQICLMNADGSSYHRITFADAAENYYPSLSPDGSNVVYASNMTGVYEIYEMELSTGIPKQLTDHLVEAYAPEISPDGISIAFATNATGYSSIWLMARDGGNPHRIFGMDGKDCVDPTWSPDGRRILFAAGVGTDKQLFTITPEGGDPRRVSETFRTRGRSDWSADGTIIGAYTWHAPNFEIFFMDPDGSNLRQMTFSGRDLAPSFSPDSQWVVYTSYSGSNDDPNACEIYSMRIDGSQNTRLTNNSYCDWQPRWGP
jgi:TolB protein